MAIPATEIRDAVVRDDVLVLTLADDKEVVVDTTLTQSGQAADAKATGEAVSQLRDDLDAITKVEKSVNILDPNQLVGGYVTLAGNVNSSSTMKYIKVKVNQGDIIRGYEWSSGAYSPSVMRYVTAYVDGIAVKSLGKENVIDYTVPDTVSEIIISFAVSIKLITINSKAPDVETEYYNRISLSDTIMDSINHDIKKAYRNELRFNAIAGECENYKCVDEDISITHSSVTDFYNLYNNLANSYPEYVSKTILGYAGGDEYPIIRYDFTPVKPYSVSSNLEFPTIIYVSGTHGGEYPSMIAGYHFFRGLCEKWKTNKLLKDLRMNVHFIAIPMFNPYGFVNQTRTNENGVDLNRNFTIGWRAEYTEAINYPGEYAASEIATQLLENLCKTTKHIFGIDHHVFGSFSTSANPQKCWYSVANTEKPQDCALADMIAVWGNGKFFAEQSKYADMANSYTQTIEGSNPSGYLYGAFNNGILVETMSYWGDEELEAEKPSQQFCTEMLASTLYMAWRKYSSYINRFPVN